MSQTRRNIVFGTGNPNADILIVTDSPTSSQDKAGTHATHEIRWLVQMFKKVTNSKNKLESCAEQMLKRVFIVSATMCMPVKSEGSGSGETRAPLYKEIKACSPRLNETIYAVDPTIILVFGSSARSAVFAKQSGLDITGNRLEFVDIPGKAGFNVRYSVLLASSLKAAEDAGDYHYKNGKSASVELVLRKAFNYVNALNAEDKI